MAYLLIHNGTLIDGKGGDPLPEAAVLVEGERWTAIADRGQAEPEEEVIITKVEGLKLRVTKKE